MPTQSFLFDTETLQPENQPLNPHERFDGYTGGKCWQAHISEVNLSADLKEAGLTESQASQLRIEDFDFRYVDSANKEGCLEVKKFIKRHEWLGKMPTTPTHRFTARLKKKGTLAGVIVMSTPNTFSYLLGKENRDKEKLISRGACISWSPKNTASWLIMQSIKWMVNNTSFRYFTAYSDPEAKELGTIYQACNFIYLGQSFGSGYQYLDPNNPSRGWFGEAGFNDRSQIVRYAKALDIKWQPDWFKYVGTNKTFKKVNWANIPTEIADRLKQERTEHKARCEQRPSPSKHKYCYILGRDKRETKHYKQLFKDNNPDKIDLAYPSVRGS